LRSAKSFSRRELAKVTAHIAMRTTRTFEEYLHLQNLDIDELPFDLEELIDEFIQQDQVYKEFIN
jgi:hypothetical protein